MTLPKRSDVEQEIRVIYVTYYARKSTRIPNYDYSTHNYYFITICSHNRRCIFGTPFQLNRLGLIVNRHILKISEHYKNVYVDKYVVMPNHIHMILVMEDSNGRVNMNQVIGQFKSGVSREIHEIIPGKDIWQRSFHDHIIRNQPSYEKIWMYIDANPINWDKDCFYIDQSVVSAP